MTQKRAIFCLLLLVSSVLNMLAVNSKVVRVGVHNNPPLCSVNSDNQAEGIFIDLIDLIAEKNNWEVEYQPYNFLDALDAVQKGQIDLLTTIAYSEEREGFLQFCEESIFTNWGVIYTGKGSDIKNIPDLGNKRLGMERGDIHSKVFKELLDAFNVKPNIVWCSNPEDVFQKLRNKEIDAGAVNKVFGFRQNIDHQLNATSILFNPVNVKIAGGSQAGVLLDQIDQTLVEMKEKDPQLFESIINQWLITSVEKEFPQWLYILIFMLVGVSFTLIVVLFVLRNSVRIKSKRLQNEKQQRLSGEKAIKQLEHEKTLILNSIDEQVIFLNTNYELVWANDAFKKFAKKPFDELVGKKCYELYFDLTQPCECCNFEQCLQTNSSASMEHFHKKSGRFFHAKTHPVLNQDNRPIGFVEILSDVSEKKQSEKALIAAKERAEQSDYLKSAFLANMSHEIRTPMNAIIGFSELIEDETLTNDEKKTYVEIIQSNGQQLLKLISDILVFSQIESGHIEMQYSLFGITDFLDAIYHQFRNDTKKHNKKLSVDFEVNGIAQGLQLESDPVRLKQVVYNLLTNAIKFTEEGSVTLGAHVQNEHLIIYVKDTGVGIPKESHRDIFKRFAQVNNSKVRKAAGSGLGLTIANDLMKRLGGEIKLESEVSVGSTFYLIHPIKRLNTLKNEVGLENMKWVHEN